MNWYLQSGKESDVVTSTRIRFARNLPEFKFNLKNKNEIEKLKNKLNVSDKNEDYLTKGNNIYITNEGNIAIFNKLYRKIDQLYLHKQR